MASIAKVRRSQHRDHHHSTSFLPALQQLHFSASASFTTLLLFIILLFCTTFSPCQSQQFSPSLSPAKSTQSKAVLPFGTVLSGSRRAVTNANGRSPLAPSATGASANYNFNPANNNDATVQQPKLSPKSAGQLAENLAIAPKISTATSEQASNQQHQPLTTAESSNQQIVHQFKFAFHNSPLPFSAHRPSSSSSSSSVNDDEGTESHLLLLDEGDGNSRSRKNFLPHSRLYEAYQAGNAKRGDKRSSSHTVQAHYLPGSSSAIYVDSSEELVDDFVAASHQPADNSYQNPKSYNSHHSLFSQSGPTGKYVAVKSSDLGTEAVSSNEANNSRTVKNFVIPLPTHQLHDRSLATGVIVISQDGGFPRTSSSSGEFPDKNDNDEGDDDDAFSRQFHYEVLTSSLPATTAHSKKADHSSHRMIRLKPLSASSAEVLMGNSRQADSAERTDELAETEAENENKTAESDESGDDNRPAKRHQSMFGTRSVSLAAGKEAASGGSSKLESALTITMENKLKQDDAQAQPRSQLSDNDSFIASSLKARIHLSRPRSTNSFNIDLVKTTKLKSDGEGASSVNQTEPKSNSFREREAMLSKVRGDNGGNGGDKSKQELTSTRSRRRQQTSSTSAGSSSSLSPSLPASVNLLNTSAARQSNFILKQRRNDKFLRTLNTTSFNSEGARNATTFSSSSTTERPNSTTQSAELTTTTAKSTSSRSSLNSLVKELNLALKDRLRQLESFNQTLAQSQASLQATSARPEVTTTMATTPASAATTTISSSADEALLTITTMAALSKEDTCEGDESGSTIVTTTASSMTTSATSTEKAASSSSEEDEDEPDELSVTTSTPELPTTSSSSPANSSEEESTEEEGEGLTTMATSITTRSPLPTTTTPKKFSSSEEEEEEEDEATSSEENESSKEVVTLTTTTTTTTTTLSPPTTTASTTTSTAAPTSISSKPSSIKKGSLKKSASKSSSSSMTAKPTSNSNKKSKLSKNALLKSSKNSTDRISSASTAKVTVKPATKKSTLKGKNSAASSSSESSSESTIQLRMNVSLTGKKIIKSASKDAKSKQKKVANLSSNKQQPQTIVESANKKSSNKTLQFSLETSLLNNSKVDKSGKSTSKQQKKREQSRLMEGITSNSTNSSTSTTATSTASTVSTPSTTSSNAKWNSGQLIWSLWNPTSGTVSTTTSKPVLPLTTPKQAEATSKLQPNSTFPLERRPPGPPKIPNNFGFANAITRDNSHFFEADEVIDSDEELSETGETEPTNKRGKEFTSTSSSSSVVSESRKAVGDQKQDKRVERKRDFDDDDDDDDGDDDESDDDLADTNVPGSPGVDYPILGHIPETGFDCSRQQYPGFYSDMQVGCQVYHSCSLASIPTSIKSTSASSGQDHHNSSSSASSQPNLASNPVSRLLTSATSNSARRSTLLSGGRHSFLCPNGTIFSQEYLICDWWYNVKCDESPRFYPLNRDVFTSGAGGGGGRSSLDSSADSNKSEERGLSGTSGGSTAPLHFPSRTDTLASAFPGKISGSSLSTSTSSQQNNRPSLLFSVPHFGSSSSSNSFQHPYNFD